MLQFAAFVLALYGIFVVPWHRHVATVDLHERSLAESTALPATGQPDTILPAPSEQQTELTTRYTPKDNRRERKSSSGSKKAKSSSRTKPGKAMWAGANSSNRASTPSQEHAEAQDAGTTLGDGWISTAPAFASLTPRLEPPLPPVDVELSKAWQILSSVRVANELRTTGVTPKDVLKLAGNASEVLEGAAYANMTLEDGKRLWRSALRSASGRILSGANYTLVGERRSRVFATKDTFYLTHAGASNELPQEPIVDNFLASVLPPTGAPPQLDSCALVGNAKGLLREPLGRDIDSHAAVIRINQAPAEGFESYVGSRTTHRLLNHKWASSYEAEALGMRTKKKRAEEPLYLELNVTLIVSRTDWKEFRKLAKALRSHRADVKLLLLSREEVDTAGDLLRFLKLKVEGMRGAEYRGKGSPSSGFVAVHLLLQMCKSLDVYGVGDGMEDSWHYFQTRQFQASREFGEAPHHSFDLEGDILQVMDGGGIIHHHLARPLSPPPAPPKASESPTDLTAEGSQPPSSIVVVEPSIEESPFSNASTWDAPEADALHMTMDNLPSVVDNRTTFNDSVSSR
eukprot:jgi/Mesvir1/8152/Mv12463-RA.1